MSVAKVETTAVDTYPRMEVVANGVHAFIQMDGSWGLSNAGLVCGTSDVLLIDTCFTERRNTILREMVMKAAPMPPTLLVNTHHHGDHVYGNGWFDEATVISHESTRSSVLTLDAAVSARRFAGVEFGNTRPTPADITFGSRLQIHIDDMTIDVFCPGIAHCAGNTAVFVRERSVLFAGDLLLKGCTPAFIGGSAHGYLPVLAELRALEPEWIVPGHGAICDASIIDETQRYVEFVLELASTALARGMTPLDAARTADIGEFADWCDGERLVGNLYRATSEIADDGDGAKLDVGAMWRDTEAYLGHPMRSLA